MRYLLLIYISETDYETWHPDMQAAMDEYWAYDARLERNGQLIFSHALASTSLARTVRVRDGHVEVTDGPFAETREQLGGAYLVEAAGRDEAVRLASDIPDARFGCVEVRPLLELTPPAETHAQRP